MSISLTEEDEEVVNRLVESGQFQNASAAVHEAIARLAVETGSGLGLETAAVVPRGSLLHLYTEEENANELAFVRALRHKKLEEF